MIGVLLLPRNANYVILTVFQYPLLTKTPTQWKRLCQLQNIEIQEITNFITWDTSSRYQKWYKKNRAPSLIWPKLVWKYTSFKQFPLYLGDLIILRETGSLLIQFVSRRLPIIQDSWHRCNDQVSDPKKERSKDLSKIHKKPCKLW